MQTSVSVRNLDAIFDDWAGSNQPGSRNANLPGLIRELVRANAAEDAIYAVIVAGYERHWPDDVDDDLEAQIAHAYQTVLATADENFTSGIKSNGAASPANLERREEARELAKIKDAAKKFDASRILECKNDTFDWRPVEVDQHDIIARVNLLASVMRTLHGTGGAKLAFFGNHRQTTASSKCWLKVDASLERQLTGVFAQLLTDRAPCFIANVNFRAPAEGVAGTTEWRNQANASSVRCFTVEMDRLLDGTEATTGEQKQELARQQRSLINWLNETLGLRPFLVCTSGNVSIHASYLLKSDDNNPDRIARAVRKFKKLKTYLAAAGADPGCFSVPRLFRAPGAMRPVEDENGKVTGRLQECLHFDPNAPRFDLDDVLARCAKAFGNGTPASNPIQELADWLLSRGLSIRRNLVTGQLDHNCDNLRLLSSSTLDATGSAGFKPRARLRNSGLPASIAALYAADTGRRLGNDLTASYLEVIADQLAYDPVIDYLEDMRRLPDDGVDHFQHIFDLYDVTSPHDQSAIRKWFRQAAIVAFNNDRPVDEMVGTEFVLVFSGGQHFGKTLFFESIVPEESLFRKGHKLIVTDRDSVMKAERTWICELAELETSTLSTRQEAGDIKAFITRSHDYIRDLFGKIPDLFVRHASFCGTVNVPKFLQDATGNRRFWVIPVKRPVPKEKLLAFGKPGPNGEPCFRDRLWAQVMREIDTLGNDCFRFTDAEYAYQSGSNALYTESQPHEDELRYHCCGSVPCEYSAGELAEKLEIKGKGKAIGKVLSALSCAQPGIPAFCFRLDTKHRDGFHYLMAGFKTFPDAEKGTAWMPAPGVDYNQFTLDEIRENNL